MKTIKGVSALLCMLGLFAVGGARAETISVKITVPGATILVDSFTTGRTPTDYGNVNISGLNAALSAAGSAYEFAPGINLLGSSGWPGGPSLGFLNLNGDLLLPSGATGSTSLSITESESGFLLPSSGSPNILLFNSSVAEFSNRGMAGDSQVSDSSFDSLPPVAVTLISTGLESGATFERIPLSTPYSLQNTIAFHLTPGVSDPFFVEGGVAPAPEPSAAVLLSVVLAGFAGLLLATQWAMLRECMAFGAETGDT